MNNKHLYAMHYENSVPTMMISVVIALLPAIVVQVSYHGSAYLTNIAFSVLFCVILEASFFTIQKKPLSFIKDSSAIVTGILISLSIPPGIGIGYILFGCVFAIIIAKGLFGGIGFNIFNPAMVGFCALLISFPGAMSASSLHESTLENWMAHNSLLSSISQYIQSIFIDMHYTLDHSLSNTSLSDASTGATLLDKINWRAVSEGSSSTLSERSEYLMQTYSQNGTLTYWIYLQLAYTIGGLYLISRRIISLWQPLSFLISAFLCVIFLQMLGTGLSIEVNIFGGSLIFGAFFILTDPVTSASSTIGKIIQAFLVGFLAIIIRSFSNYPDGVAFAVLLGNFISPSIDLIFRTKVYGKQSLLQKIIRIK